MGTNSYRILFIVTSGEVGGAQKFVKEQIEMLHKVGFVCFLASNRRQWLYNQVAHCLTDTFLDDRIESVSVKYLMNLRKFIKRNGIDLTVCNSANGGFYGRMAAWQTGCKSVYVSHGWSSIYNGGKLSFLFNAVERVLSTISDSVLCISKNDAKIARSIGISDTKIHQISNCIQPVGSCPSNIQIGKRILAVARLAHPKRIDLLILAMKAHPDAHLDIVGGGMQYKNLENIIQREHILNVTLVGEVPGFSDFGSYDIFALISESEGLPISALEAMSAGLALLISNVGGCWELVNGNGALVANRPDAISLGIQDCLDHIEIYKRKSLELFNERFNLAISSDKYIQYYENIIRGCESL